MSRPDRAPDAAEPIVGWRVWLASPERRDAPRRRWLLDSPFAPAPRWPSREAIKAQCEPLDIPGAPKVSDDVRARAHAAPNADCACGLYGLSEIHAAAFVARHCAVGKMQATLVLGEVSLWGRVVVSTRGYRAQFAYPRRLWVLPRAFSDGLPVAFRSAEPSEHEIVVDGLKHYGVELADSRTGPQPVLNLLGRLNQRLAAQQMKRPDAMVTSVQNRLHFISFAGGRGRVLDGGRCILYGEQSSAEILAIGTWENSGYVPRERLMQMVRHCTAVSEPWPPTRR